MYVIFFPFVLPGNITCKCVTMCILRHDIDIFKPCFENCVKMLVEVQVMFNATQEGTLGSNPQQLICEVRSLMAGW